MIRRPPRSTPLSLHDALPISRTPSSRPMRWRNQRRTATTCCSPPMRRSPSTRICGEQHVRSEEHTSELQSRQYLVCRLLLEKKNDTMAAQLKDGNGRAVEPES